MMIKAFMLDRSREFDQLEDAMGWLIDQARRRGFASAEEAIEKGYADIFGGRLKSSRGC